MNDPIPDLTRRGLLSGGGALVVSFAIGPRLALAQGEEAEVVEQRGELPGSLKDYPFVDSWIRIGADDTILVMTGKAELGQGIKTAIIQIAAEQLQVALPRITLQTADTGMTPNEGYTAASHSMEESGTAVLHAAAQARRVLLDLAAGRLGVPVETLSVEDGVIVGAGQRIRYGELVDDQLLHVRVDARDEAHDPSGYTIMGEPVPRVDIPPKLTGEVAYVHDLRLPGMVHARVVRPPVYDARLESADIAAVEAMPGVLGVVRDGSYLAVVAEGEYQAVRAMAALQASARWTGGMTLPDGAGIADMLRSLPSQENVIHETGPGGAAGGAGARRVEATYTRPYQMHGSIGPSCAVGLAEDGGLTVWSHTQGVYPDRAAIAEMLGVSEDVVRVIHMEGSGCYGHNGADDAAADAALIARAFPGRPVRVLWMREQEHMWEPYGSGMVVSASAGLDPSGGISDWSYDLWSTTHVTRPPPARNLAPAWLLERSLWPPKDVNIPQPAGGADRNAVPPYTIPNARVVEHYIPVMPLRVSALRSLGAFMNVFALESFVDELALAAGADPVAFRLARLEDPRAREVVQAAADRFGWADFERGPGRGRGFAYARYKNLAAYCAVAMEVEVEGETGEIRIGRVVAACDSGQVVNPNGIANQIEGGIVQSSSWTRFEEVRVTPDGILSRDWASYPILRFPHAPASVEVHVVDRPGEPFLGTGEAAQGPAAAAIANAVADATGARLRDLPLTAEKVRAALAG